MTSHITPRVFISYARSDGEEFARQLRERLEAEKIPLWQDRVGMEGGRDWWLQITKALDQVEFMVLVMTPNALVSQMVRKEWRYARQQGVCVYPVKAASDLDFSTVPRWMSSAHWYDLKHEWPKFVNDLNTRCQQPRVPFMVEDLPEGFVPRPDEFNALRSLLLDSEREEPIAITAALRGAGGFGKTTLAQALCHDEDIQNAFDDGILWVTLGEKPGDLTGKIENLIWILCKERPNFKSDVSAASFRLAELLADRDILLVIDDVWDSAHLKPFLQGGPRCARLVTTRMEESLPQSARRVDVDAMTRDEAVQLLCFGIETTSADREPLENLAERLGEWPLLLKLVNGVLWQRVKHGHTLPDSLAYGNKALGKGITFFDVKQTESRHQAVKKTIGVSLELLSHEENERFTELAVFPEDVDIPLATLERLWGKTGGLDEIDVEDICGRLFRMSLLLRFDLATRQIRLHDVIRLYLLEQRKKDIRQLHETLLSLHRPESGWSALPPEEPYLWDHLAYHLSEAGNYDELRTIFEDDRWLYARVTRSGYIYSGYLADLAVAWKMADGKVAEDETYIADCFRYGLIKTSINSLANKYEPELIVEAVKTGLWSPDRAISVAENTPSQEQACKLLTLLLRTDKLTDTQRTRAGNKALAFSVVIDGEWSRAKALAAVAGQLSGAEKAAALRQALDAALAIGDKWSRADALAALAGQLSGEEKATALRQALDAALAIDDERSRADALAALAEQLNGAEKAAALRQALDAALAIGDERWRAEALAAAAGQLSGEEKATALRQALDAALAIGDERWRAEALAAVAGQLSGEEKATALRQALDVALAIDDERSRAKALAAVAGQLSGAAKAATLQKALDAALAIKEEYMMADALIAVAGQLGGAEKAAALRQALDAALAIGNEWSRADALAALAAVAGQLSNAEKAAVLRQTRDAAKRSRADTLAAVVAVAGQLCGAGYPPILQQVLDAALTIRDERWRARVLATVAGELSREEIAPELRKILHAAYRMWDIKCKLQVLTAIKGHLSDEEMNAVLTYALNPERASDWDPWEQYWDVKGMLHCGKREPATFVQKLIADISTKYKTWLRRAIAAKAKLFNDSRKVESVRKGILNSYYNMERARLLVGDAEWFDGERKAAVLRQALDAALAISDEWSRLETLVTVVRQLSGVENAHALRQAFDAVLNIKHGEARAKALAAVARHLSGEEKAAVIKQTLDTALAINNQMTRVNALTEVSEELSDKENAPALYKALFADPNIGNEKWQPKVLANLLPHLDKTTALNHAKDCLHRLETATRADFLDNCFALLPKLTLQTETIQRIDKSYTDIKTKWYFVGERSKM